MDNPRQAPPCKTPNLVISPKTISKQADIYRLLYEMIYSVQRLECRHIVLRATIRPTIYAQPNVPSRSFKLSHKLPTLLMSGGNFWGLCHFALIQSQVLVTLLHGRHCVSSRDLKGDKRWSWLSTSSLPGECVYVKR